MPSDRAGQELTRDGTVGDVYFSGRTWTGVFKPLPDPAYFAQVKVDPEAATIVWPDGLDMAPEASTRKRASTL